MFGRREQRPGGKDKVIAGGFPSGWTLVGLAILIGVSGGLTSGAFAWLTAHKDEVRQFAETHSPETLRGSPAAPSPKPETPPAARNELVSVDNTAALSRALVNDGFPNELFRLRVVQLSDAFNRRKWMMVDNSDAGSDAIIEFIVRAEEHVLEAFSMSLDPESCAAVKALPEPFLDCSQGPDPAGRVWMADVGSNSGFYGLMAGSMGYPTVFMEPQPHCAQYVRTSALASGHGNRARVLNSFAGDATRADFDTVQRRTGCWGTFPYLDESQKKSLEGSFGGIDKAWRDKVPVPMLTLDDAVLGPAGGAERDVVIAAMKVDVEGSEDSMMRGAERLLAQGRVFNIVMELNKPAWKSAGIDGEAVAIPMLQGLAEQGFRCRFSNRGGWGLQTDMEMSTEALSVFFKEGWLSLDLWCTLPAGKRHVLK